MKPARIALLGAALACTVFGAVALAAQACGADAAPTNASPIYGVTIPEGYRQWQFIAPAHETDPLNELRVVVGNPTAIKAYQDGTLPFPDGTILVKLAWKHVQSTEFAPAYVPGAATTVQVMVEDPEALCRHRRLGLRPLHRWQAGRPGPARDLLGLPPGQCEGP